ncbi:hypothetical protein HDU76_004842 [Blyttiomyces sp. JEL0837]|nr:hypothetical protein HDU76_004842 [Blyttiomyces sp. JEL0837]
MTPAIATTENNTSVDQVIDSIKNNLSINNQLHRAPLVPSGALDAYEKFDVTAHIGTEFKNGVQVVDLLNAPNSDDLIRDLAILVSRRGVVFFRSQEINTEQQKELASRLGTLAGKPSSSGLHVHPLTPESSELGDEITVITSEGNAEYQSAADRSELASTGWHSDITFEKVPSDYAILKIHTLPPTGGDTLWASGYEVYDRLSAPLQNLLQTLNARHNADFFKYIAKHRGNEIRTNRGSPENQGDDLTAIHPVIRTHPVTGWKSVFVNQGFTKRIEGVSKDESDLLLEFIFKLISQNHDLQVRFKWNKNDLAIWDNRATYHSATWDYGKEKRVGDRAVSLGEKPYFDPNGTSRRESLGLAPVREVKKGSL